MAKRIDQKKLTKSNHGMSIEQTTASDDNLLPSPSDMAAYKSIDECFIPWILEQTKAEQEHRHITDLKKIDLMKRAVKNEKIALYLYVFIISMFIIISAFFVYLDKNIAGSIFGVFGVLGFWKIYQVFQKK